MVLSWSELETFHAIAFPAQFSVNFNWLCLEMI